MVDKVDKLDTAELEERELELVEDTDELLEDTVALAEDVFDEIVSIDMALGDWSV